MEACINKLSKGKSFSTESLYDLADRRSRKERKFMSKGNGEKKISAINIEKINIKTERYIQPDTHSRKTKVSFLVNNKKSSLGPKGSYKNGKSDSDMHRKKPKVILKPCSKLNVADRKALEKQLANKAAKKAKRVDSSMGDMNRKSKFKNKLQNIICACKGTNNLSVPNVPSKRISTRNENRKSSSSRSNPKINKSRHSFSDKFVPSRASYQQDKTSIKRKSKLLEMNGQKKKEKDESVIKSKHMKEDDKEKEKSESVVFFKDVCVTGNCLTLWRKVKDRCSLQGKSTPSGSTTTTPKQASKDDKDSKEKPKASRFSNFMKKQDKKPDPKKDKKPDTKKDKKPDGTKKDKKDKKADSKKDKKPDPKKGKKSDSKKDKKPSNSQNTCECPKKGAPVVICECTKQDELKPKKKKPSLTPKDSNTGLSLSTEACAERCIYVTEDVGKTLLKLNTTKKTTSARSDSNASPSKSIGKDGKGYCIRVKCQPAGQTLDISKHKSKIKSKSYDQNANVQKKTKPGSKVGMTQSTGSPEQNAKSTKLPQRRKPRCKIVYIRSNCYNTKRNALNDNKKNDPKTKCCVKSTCFSRKDASRSADWSMNRTPGSIFRICPNKTLKTIRRSQWENKCHKSCVRMHAKYSKPGCIETLSNVFGRDRRNIARRPCCCKRRMPDHTRRAHSCRNICSDNQLRDGGSLCGRLLVKARETKNMIHSKLTCDNRPASCRNVCDRKTSKHSKEYVNSCSTTKVTTILTKCVKKQKKKGKNKKKKGMMASLMKGIGMKGKKGKPFNLMKGLQAMAKKKRKKKKKKKKPKGVNCKCEKLFYRTLRHPPCLAIRTLYPNVYPQVVSMLATLKQMTRVLLYCLAAIVWCPCIMCAECFKCFICI